MSYSPKRDPNTGLPAEADVYAHKYFQAPFDPNATSFLDSFLDDVKSFFAFPPNNKKLEEMYGQPAGLPPWLINPALNPAYH